MKKLLEPTYATDATTTTSNGPEYGKMPCDGVSVDYLTAAGNKALAEKIQAMTAEELEVVADNIPVELCLKRIEKELAKAKNLANAIMDIKGLL